MSADKDKLNSSKASSETVSTASLNESEDSLERLTSNSLDSPPRGGTAAPIKSYVNLAETTQERIRQFEQETKAMLQREINRGQRRREYFGLDEQQPVAQPNEVLMLAKDFSPGNCHLYARVLYVPIVVFMFRVLYLFAAPKSHGQSVQRNSGHHQWDGGQTVQRSGLKEQSEAFEDECRGC